MPLSGGTARKKLSSASTPPADAPIPTIGKRSLAVIAPYGFLCRPCRQATPPTRRQRTLRGSVAASHYPKRVRARRRPSGASARCGVVLDPPLEPGDGL